MNKLDDRICALDWDRLAASLDEVSYAVAPRLLSPEECRGVSDLYAEGDIFRSRVVMARHGYGRGEYKYFAYPLPALVASLRAALYPHLAKIANAWSAQLGQEPDWPDAHEDLLARCKSAGQVRPTPLILRYEAGDYNCLHQDLYGEVHFPLQAAILLDQ
ncbi:MAG: 2OG-Fe(II) oxygenase, partial [Maricaulaceae bacterium]